MPREDSPARDTALTAFDMYRDALSAADRCREMFAPSRALADMLAPSRSWADAVAMPKALADMLTTSKTWADALAPLASHSQRLDLVLAVASEAYAPTLAQAHDLARAGVQARRLARSNARLAVDIVRLLREQLANGRDCTAAVIVSALTGDPEALDDLHDLAGDPGNDLHDLARRVLDIVARLDALAAEVEQLLDTVAGLLAPALIAAVEAHLEPPPREGATARRQTTGPPARARRGQVGRLHDDRGEEPGHHRHRYDP